MALTEFVTARLDEWERLAQAELDEPGWNEYDPDTYNSPQRVLAQVASMRAIVDRYERALKRDRSNTGDLAAAGRTLALHGVMKYLAAIWRDHPDYDPAWAPEEQ